MTVHDEHEPEPWPPRNWAELAPLVDTVLDTPIERRAAMLTTVSGGDPVRRAALERLIEECERDMPLLDRPATEQFDQLLEEEAEPPLPDLLGGRYRIAREVGRGGMARVYLARDLKHARDVAVKVIRPDLAASLGRRRFLDEIAIAAGLRHPNIVPLYDSGDADGVLYFVMPYEEGPSLRTRLNAGDAIPIAECVSTLRDVARALAHAHERGVIHRDVKPDNVMLSGGAAVVADFGIATAVNAAQDQSSPDAPRPWSTGVGTPDYMAPEQAAGDPSTDHRADLYSLGCLAYELFAGTAPFHTEPRDRIVAAHATVVPASVITRRADVPVAIATLIARCLEKDPLARPQSAREVMLALDVSPDATRPRRLAKVAAVAAAIAVVASLAVWQWPQAASGDTTNNEAMRLYLIAQQKLSQRTQGVSESADLFRRAIALDSNFGKAYAGLSMALALYPNQHGQSVDSIHLQLATAARRAIANAPALAVPHVALGIDHGYQYQWDSAATAFRTALSRDRANIEALTQYSRHLRNRGNLREALRQLRIARDLDPKSAVVLSQLSYVFYLDGQLDSALAESKRALDNDPRNRTAVVFGALVLLATGQPNDARTLIALAPATTPFSTYVIAKSGDTAAARELLAKELIEAPTTALGNTRVAYSYLGLGDTASALSGLERATAAREIWPVLVSYLDPVHDSIRGSARFNALLRTVGLMP